MPDPFESETTAPGTNGACHVLSDKPSPDAGVNCRCHPLNDIPPTAASAVLELRVRNHPGTMSHITGLFARRGFNLEAIVCAPVHGGRESCMLLLVADEPRLDQVERQHAKLYDVLALRHRPDVPAEFYQRLISSAATAAETRDTP